MNHRQAKKKKKNEILFLGMTYLEDRKCMRALHELEIDQRRCRTIPEDLYILIELGIFTEQEVAERYYSSQKAKRRNVQLRRMGYGE